MNGILVLAGCLIPALFCAVKDLKDYVIPNIITIPMLVAGVVYATFTKNLPGAMLGFAFTAGTIMVCVLLGGAGGGDVKLGAALGMWLGYPNALVMLLIASVMGVIYGFYKMYKLGTLKARLRILCMNLVGFMLLLLGSRGAINLPRLPDDMNAPAPPDAIPFGACIVLAGWLVWMINILVWEGFWLEISHWI